MNSPGNNKLGLLDEDTRQSFLETELKLLLAIQKATVLVLFSTYSVLSYWIVKTLREHYNSHNTLEIRGDR